jgi:hypothetical protein
MNPIDFSEYQQKKKKSKNLIRLSINMYDLIKMDKLRGGYP